MAARLQVPSQPIGRVGDATGLASHHRLDCRSVGVAASLSVMQSVALAVQCPTGCDEASGLIPGS